LFSSTVQKSVNTKKEEEKEEKGRTREEKKPGE
jgi:hypothetical protein